MTTTDLPEIIVFDVGHANCAIVRDANVVFVIDVPQRDGELTQALITEKITKIDTVLISHGDEDHAAGLSSLLVLDDVTVTRIYINSEALRKTRTWEAIRIAVRDATKRCPDLVVHTELTSACTAELQLPRLKTEVLAPSPQLALAGAGGTTIDGKGLSSNSMSAVVRFSTDKTCGIMLAGDIDRVGLDELLVECNNPEAEILVFPHHGGLPGRAAPESFAAELTAAVKPSVVVFSLASNEVNPRREIVAGVRQSCPKAHIACTELSHQCAKQHPSAAQPYLGERPARGRDGLRGGSCCAGTLEFEFTPDGVKCHQLPGHATWVEAHLPDRICALQRPTGNFGRTLTGLG